MPKFVDGQLEGAKVAFRRADLPLRHWKVGNSRRLQSSGRLDEHRHVEMLLEQIGGVDRLLVTPINERHALAVEFDEGNFGHSFGCRSNQRRHLGTCLRCLRGPTRGLTNIRVTDIGAAFAPFGDLGKERRFLRAGDDQRIPAGRGCAESLEFSAAKLTRRRDLTAPTAAPHRFGVERYRVFARANQNTPRLIRHADSGAQGLRSIVHSAGEVEASGAGVGPRPFAISSSSQMR